MDSFSESSDSLPPPPPPPPQSNTKAASSLFATVPDDINTIQQKLFEIRENEYHQMLAEEFQLYWPYLDNLFLQKMKQEAKGKVTKYYTCCLYSKKAWESKVQPGERQRNQTARKPIACPY